MGGGLFLRTSKVVDRIQLAGFLVLPPNKMHRGQNSGSQRPWPEKDQQQLWAWDAHRWGC